MVEEVTASFLGKLAALLVDPIVRQCCYVFQYRSNIKHLKDEVKGLQASREGVKIQVDAAKYNFEVVNPAMKEWAERVDEIETKASTIIKRTTNVDKKCFNVWCPNVTSRYSLSRNATKLTSGIGRLKREGKSYEKSEYSAPPPGVVTADSLLPELTTRIDTTPSIRSCEDLESRKSIFKQVMDALEDDRTRMVGISGTGGVGKTTFVNEICRKARAKSLFKQFAMMTVSKNQDLIKIQDELAEMLGLKFTEEKTMLGRAHRLRSRLTDGSKILVILDDVWEEIPLKQVGIPGKDDRGGCKVLFTSRYTNVFIDMGTQLNVTVEALTYGESRHLFGEIIGEYNRHFSKEIVDNCKGIPIAIVTLARALRKGESATWGYALDQLNQPTETEISGADESENAAYKSVKLSYNLLQDHHAKNLLVLCCLFQEDANIPLRTLLRLNGSSDVLIGKLKSCNLLEDGNYPGTVKVHDIVRDVCLATEGLDKWPQNLSLADQPSGELENGDIKSRKSTFKELWDALMDNNIYTIGILGMAGIGKTKMVCEIREKARGDNLFDEVVMSSVSKNDLHRVQHDLGEMLGLVSLRENSNVIKGAELLHQRLTNGKRFLVILDDVWEKRELQDIGIPHRGMIRGCKVIITTQIEKVCHEMGIQKIVKLGPLSEEEALDLFKKKAGLLEKTGYDSDFDSIGKEIVSDCERLPLAVLEIASSLSRYRELRVWKDYLEHLKYSYYRETQTVRTLKTSYDGLNNPEAQLLLLLCSIMGENINIPIEKLVICVKRVELFGDSMSLEELRIRVHSLVDMLWGASLLLTSANGTVRVHQFVRRLCLQLLSEYESPYHNIGRLKGEGSRPGPTMIRGA